MESRITNSLMKWELKKKVALGPMALASARPTSRLPKVMAVRF